MAYGVVHHFKGGTKEQYEASIAAVHPADGSLPAGPALEVAGLLCGVRAQLPHSAELALWARVEGLQPGEITQALDQDRTLVKTWVRNRSHVIPSDDLARYVAALHPRPEGPGDA